jgi:hypothetical protein
MLVSTRGTLLLSRDSLIYSILRAHPQFNQKSDKNSNRVIHSIQVTSDTIYFERA